MQDYPCACQLQGVSSTLTKPCTYFSVKSKDANIYKYCFSKRSYYYLFSSTWGKTWYCSENKPIWKAIFKKVKYCNKLTPWQGLVRFAVINITV